MRSLSGRDTGDGQLRAQGDGASFLEVGRWAHRARLRADDAGAGDRTGLCWKPATKSSDYLMSQ